MPEGKVQEIPTVGRRRLALIAACLGAGLAGYALALTGILPLAGKDASTPLARVGFALREAKPSGAASDWAALGADLEVLRAAASDKERDVLDLVVALRGLESEGAPDFARAAELCQALKWPRCDQRALELLEKRSRP